MNSEQLSTLSYLIRTSTPAPSMDQLPSEYLTSKGIEALANGIEELAKMEQAREQS